MTEVRGEGDGGHDASGGGGGSRASHMGCVASELDGSIYYLLSKLPGL